MKTIQELETENAQLRRDFDLQRANYVRLTDAVLGTGTYAGMPDPVLVATQLREQIERLDAVLKLVTEDNQGQIDRAYQYLDWCAMFEAFCQHPFPVEHRTRHLWPNSWHKDCAMVAFALATYFNEGKAP